MYISRHIIISSKETFFCADSFIPFWDKEWGHLSPQSFWNSIIFLTSCFVFCGVRWKVHSYFPASCQLMVQQISLLLLPPSVPPKPKLIQVLQGWQPCLFFGLSASPPVRGSRLTRSSRCRSTTSEALPSSQPPIVWLPGLAIATFSPLGRSRENPAFPETSGLSRVICGQFMSKRSVIAMLKAFPCY